MEWSSKTDYFLEANDSRLWLKEDFHYLKNSEIWLDLNHPNLSSHFKMKSLIEVLALQHFIVTIQNNKETQELDINFHFLQPNMDPGSNPLVLTVRPDSYETLSKIASAFPVDLTKEL